MNDTGRKSSLPSSVSEARDIRRELQAILDGCASSIFNLLQYAKILSLTHSPTKPLIKASTTTLYSFLISSLLSFLTFLIILFFCILLVALKATRTRQTTTPETYLYSLEAFFLLLILFYHRRNFFLLRCTPSDFMNEKSLAQSLVPSTLEYFLCISCAE